MGRLTTRPRFRSATPLSDWVGNVNIGDSNQRRGRRRRDESNHAEIHIGREETQFNKDLFVFGKDGTPTPGGLLAQAPNFVGSSTTTATITVRNEFVSWDDHQGVSGGSIPEKSSLPMGSDIMSFH